jgi:hypothetical protein
MQDIKPKALSDGGEFQEPWLQNRYYRSTTETFNFHDFHRQIRLMHFACSHAGEIPPVGLAGASPTSFRTADHVLMARSVGRSRALSFGFGAGTTVTMTKWMAS